MTQQAENLVLIKLDIDTVYSFETVLVLFLEATDFKQVILYFFFFELRSKFFIALRIHADSLKLESFLSVFKLFAICAYLDDPNFHLIPLAATAPKTWLEEKAGVAPPAKCLRHNLF